MRAASRRRLPGRGRGKITGMMKSMLRSMFGAGGLQAVRQALDDCRHAASGAAIKPLPEGLPGFLGKEVAGLRRALESASA